MELLSKFKNAFVAVGLVAALTGLTAVPVFAMPSVSGTESSVHVDDVIDGADGKEIVVSILEDGRFVTIPANGISEFANPCTHTNIMGTGRKVQETSSYNKTDATYCYKYRFYEEARCAQCGKTGFKIYDKTWTKVKHKYKLFGDTCTVCGYKK